MAEIEAAEIIPREIADRLDPKRIKFVHGLAAGKNQRQAAIDAGFSEKSASVRAHKLMKEEAVRDALNAIRQDWATDAKYDLGAAMREIDDGIKFSRETKNATAMVKAIELRAKMSGLLNDAAIQINIGQTVDVAGALAAARARVQRPRPADDDAEEVEFKEVDQ